MPILVVVAECIARELLDGLRESGFKLNLGFKDAGFALLAWSRAGGYYLGNQHFDGRQKPQIKSLWVDVGGSQLIIDGKIKLKSDSQIERFTETGIKFENGTELLTDVVVFATG